MSEVLLPTWIIPEVETHEWLDEGSAVFGAAFAPGIAQRQSFGGLRLKLSRRHTVRLDEKAQLLSILQSTRGRFNALRTKVHFALRGSGFGTEVLSNGTFANGTTGWTATGGATPALTVADRIARLTQTLGINGSGLSLANSSGVTVAQYAALCARAMVNSGRGAFASYGVRLGPTSGSSAWAETLPSTAGFRVAAGVSDGTSAFLTALSVTGTNQAGDFIEVPYLSLARCLTVDNGLNDLLRSDEFDNAAWTKTRSSVVASAGTGPDGATTGDQLTEDSTVSSTHETAQNVTVPTAAGDQHFAAIVSAGGSRPFVQLVMSETAGSTAASAYFNLSTGAVGTAGTGANWSNLRTFARDLGGGWWQFHLIARKTNAATTIQQIIRIATADGGASYSGNGTSFILLYRAAKSLSSLPARLPQTTSAATAGTSQTGNALYVKGLPASANGLLLPGDWIEINGELKQAAEALNSDAAGLGYLQFEPALVRSPADNDPVVITDPMGKFLVSNIKIDNEFGTQAIVTYDLEHIYE